MSYMHQPTPLWHWAAWRMILMYCKNSCDRFGNSCVKTLIYVVKAVVHCSISVIFVTDWVDVLTLSVEFSSVRETGCSFVVANKFFGKSLESKKNSPVWICLMYEAGTSWKECPYGRQLVFVCVGIGCCRVAMSLLCRMLEVASATCGWSWFWRASSLLAVETGVFEIACTAARAAVVAISFTDSWTVWVMIERIWTSWALLNRGVSLWFCVPCWISLRLSRTSEGWTLSELSCDSAGLRTLLVVVACCCSLAISELRRPWSGRPLSRHC